MNPADLKHKTLILKSAQGKTVLQYTHRKKSNTSSESSLTNMKLIRQALAYHGQEKKNAEACNGKVFYWLPTTLKQTKNPQQTRLKYFWAIVKEHIGKAGFSRRWPVTPAH